MAVTIFDAFKVATESLSPEVYRNATWSSVWLNLIERGEYPVGSGTLRSTFTIANQQPSNDEESWNQISTSSGALVNSCSTSYAATGAGYDERTYNPESFSLQGPTLCKDDLSLEFNASTFIPTYVEEITKRAKKAWENRYSSVYEQLGYKYVVTGSNAYSTTTTVGTISTNSANANTGGTFGVVTSSILTGATRNVVTPVIGSIVDINQNILDGLALDLMQNGATNPDSNGFITIGSEGPVFSLYISPDASKRIIASDEAYRLDLRYNDNKQEVPELMKRIGANRVIKNWRHVPDLFPARYGMGASVTNCVLSTSTTTVTVAVGNVSASNNFGLVAGGGQSYMPDVTTGVPTAIYQGMIVTVAGGTGTLAAGTTVVSVEAGTSSAENRLTLSAAPTGNGTATLLIGGAVGRMHRIPTWLVVHSSMSGGPSKGWKAVINPGWKAAPIEAARILSPRVFKSEIIRPVDAIGSLSWNPMNNLGDFQWVTGATKFTTGNTDPTEKYGAHFAEFKHAPKPMFPSHGGSILYKRT